MRFIPTALADVYVIEPELISDERGFFARSYCQKEFADHGLNLQPVQCNISFNKLRGTLRGMHFQRQPHSEAKLVRCTMGSIYDVVIDMRADSSTFGQWYGVELSEENRRMLYIPEGFAHGFQTLADDTEVSYQMFNLFVPESASGVRWDDSFFSIKWPLPVSAISKKDNTYPDFKVSGTE